MKRIPKAGAVPWRRTKDGEILVLIITTSDGGRWIFPMGKIDSGEDPDEAAARETEEEAGVLVEIGARLPDLNRSDYWDGGYEVAMFLGEYTRETEWPESQKRDRKWVTLDRAENRLSEDFGEVIAAVREALD